MSDKLVLLLYLSFIVILRGKEVVDVIVELTSTSHEVPLSLFLDIVN